MCSQLLQEKNGKEKKTKSVKCGRCKIHIEKLILFLRMKNFFTSHKLKSSLKVCSARFIDAHIDIGGSKNHGKKEKKIRETYAAGH